MSGRRILVLGGTKYFGKHLVEMLLANGDEVTIVTRGNNSIPSGCAFIPFDRSQAKKFISSTAFDGVYDQSCLSSSFLTGLEDIIAKCKFYVLTSSQAIYPAGEALKEDLIDYNCLESIKHKINDYGFEKLQSERIVASLTENYIFPRFPVVTGIHDPRKRIQSLIQKILSGAIDLPSTNPKFQLIDANDAAKALFDLPFRNFHGAINIAADEILNAEDFCFKIAAKLNTPLNINKVCTFGHSPFDLIKQESKTLCLKKKNALNILSRDVDEVIEEIIANYDKNVC